MKIIIRIADPSRHGTGLVDALPRHDGGNGLASKVNFLGVELNPLQQGLNLFLNRISGKGKLLLGGQRLAEVPLPGGRTSFPPVARAWR